MAEGGRVAWGAEEAGEGGAGGAGDGGDARYAALMERLHHHQAERGDHTAHVRLRYLSVPRRLQGCGDSFVVLYLCRLLSLAESINVPIVHLGMGLGYLDIFDSLYIKIYCILREWDILFNCFLIWLNWCGVKYHHDFIRFVECVKQCFNTFL